MATCDDCIHYKICTFHINGNENEKCVNFLNTADVAPKSEVVREIFVEIEDVINNIGYFDEIDFEALKKKYTEVQQ